VLAGTSAEQADALNEANQSNEALKLDLEAARRVIKGLKAQAISSNEARNAMEASLAEANRSLAEERDKVEQSAHELALARQVGEANARRADLAVAERAADLQLAVAAAKHANEALDLERARSASAASDVDVARRERDAARQASASLIAALEQERQKQTDMSIALTAARKAIDLVKVQSARRTAQIEPAPRTRSTVVSLAVRDDQPVRQTSLRDKNKAKIARSPNRVLVATTITLPDALLPTPPR
jgi:hypothetical protein